MWHVREDLLKSCGRCSRLVGATKTTNGSSYGVVICTIGKSAAKRYQNLKPGVTVICVPQWCVFPEHITLGMRVSPNVYPWDRCFPEHISLRLARFNIISDICFPVINVSSRRLS